MKITYTIPACLLFLFLAVPSVVAASPATSEMAQIILHLNHYPSDDEKQSLRTIAASDQATAGERILAKALLNMEHKVGGADRERLRELARNQAAPAAERELADILLGLQHKPSAAAKERLRRLR